MNNGLKDKDSLGSKNTRCSNCYKKSLILVKCKCSLNTCLKCRSPEDHGCPIDYQELNKEILKEQNPQINSIKMDKI